MLEDGGDAEVLLWENEVLPVLRTSLHFTGGCFCCGEVLSACEASAERRGSPCALFFFG